MPEVAGAVGAVGAVGVVKVVTVVEVVRMVVVVRVVEVAGKNLGVKRPKSNKSKSKDVYLPMTMPQAAGKN